MNGPILRQTGPSCPSRRGDNVGHARHQSVWKEEKKLFQGNGYSGTVRLRPLLHSGIIKHAKA